jgi:hypothetical protein
MMFGYTRRLVHHSQLLGRMGMHLVLALAVLTGLFGSADVRAVSANNLAAQFFTGTQSGEDTVDLAHVEAYAVGSQVYVEWVTAWEAGVTGFYLYRQPEGEPPQQITSELLPALSVLGFEQGGTYRLLDPGARAGQSYSYRLVAVLSQGKYQTYGPFQITNLAQKASVLEAGPDDLTERYASPTGAVVYQRLPNGIHQPLPDVMPQAQPAGVVPASWGAARVQSTRRSSYYLWLPLIARDDAPEPPLDSVGVAKFTVETSGLYYLDAGDIANVLSLTRAQVVSLIAHRHLAVANQGQEVAILAANDNGGLYLYGQEPNSLYTSDNVYWLHAGSATAMMLQAGGPPPATMPGGVFSDTVRSRERLGAQVLLFDDPKADYWMWDYVAISSTHSSRSFPVSATGLAANGTATLAAHFVGFTTSGKGKDHFAQIAVNGTLIGEGHWAGRTPYTLTLPFNAALLMEGTNTITVTARPEPAVPSSTFLIQYFDLTYPRHYYAVADQLVVRGDGNPVITVSGFTTNTVRVFDIANPLHPQWVQNVQVIASGGSYQASFVPAARDHPYLVLTSGRAARIATLSPYQSARLKTARLGADYIIITTAAISSTARSLASYRQSQGLASLVVDIQNIYDEFNAGLTDPQAIQEFLAWAYAHWNPAPHYALLAGSGSYDYKNYLQTSTNPNLIPPYMIGTPMGLMSADVRYGDIVGNESVPEIAIGRLPVETPGQFQGVIDKIHAYEANSGDSWAHNVLMIADISDPIAGDFPLNSDDLAALVPGGYSVQKAYRQSFPTDPSAQAAADRMAHKTVTSTIQSGVGLVNFVGHGNYDRWTAPGLLVNADVAGLHNGSRLPLISAPTCGVGSFGLPGFDVLGKLLVNQPDGGGIAVWAPSGLSLNTAAVALDQWLFQARFSGLAQRAGDVTRQALQGYATTINPRFNADIYQFLGDPALLLKP